MSRSSLGRQTKEVVIQIQDADHIFRVTQLKPLDAIAIQTRIQAELAPLLYSVFKEMDTETANITTYLPVITEALRTLKPETVRFLIEELIFKSDIVYKFEDKLEPFNEGLFNMVFGGELLATWLFLYKILEVNFKSFILDLLQKYQKLGAGPIPK
jgi:hypothetical protein